MARMKVNAQILERRHSNTSEHEWTMMVTRRVSIDGRWM